MITARLLSAADRIETPWKNGGGMTAQLAAFPLGADFDAFDWRVSLARVNDGGPFSRFPGIDRNLSVLEGGLRLTFADGRVVEAKAGDPGVTFEGDVELTCALIDGPVLDLNVMTRRSAFTATVSRIVLAGGDRLALDADITLALVTHGAAYATANGKLTPLHRLDALRLSRSDEALVLEPAPAAALHVIAINAL